ncbi:hypothetical protein EVC45_14765 [Paraburkholderia sp. UYCP14C]|uniref:hypothetical protein n=1 Tax=Paraburkholderia sp. UYCP14C TaxID=2511130 RepID=UPI001022061F|nr:hypothetical protein [Paraburkholderia sp. UYCP14C]RZF29070.1 hypothetical protein EVC45_14765 [Paraburkholderia sp. UYCP14C]
MDPISTLTQAMQLLRQQLAEKQQREERTASGRSAAASMRAGQPLSTAGSLPDAIRVRIDTLRAAGVDDERQFFRAVVNLLLLREFGEEMANDPSFQQMSEWVSGCLSEQLETRHVLREIIGG